MHRLAVIDGEDCAPEDAKVSVYDRGFLYGDSVFETVRTYGGRPFKLEEHLRRLANSAAALGIPLPLALPALGAEVTAAVERVGNADSRIRIIVTRGAGPLGLDSQLAGRPLRVVLVEPLAPAPAPPYRNGIAVVCVQTVRAADAVHSAKLSNYLASVLALQDARAAGADEALVVNRDGLVVEGTTCNVFAVCARERAAELPGARPEVLCTPPLEIGVLPGITRAVVLELAAAAGLEIRERAMRPVELQQAQEVFITSSLREIVPVVRVDGVAVGADRPGPVTRELHARLRAHVGLDHEPMPWER